MLNIRENHTEKANTYRKDRKKRQVTRRSREKQGRGQDNNSNRGIGITQDN